MTSKVNRRNWLKASALVAAGLTFGTSRMNPLSAAHTSTPVRADFPPMKARLSSNENPFGPSEKAKKALIDAISDSYLYPRDLREEFTQVIAKEEGVSEDCIMLGAGSTELLLAAALNYSLKGAGNTIVSADPSYVSMMRMAENYGAKWEKTPLDTVYSHDLNEMDRRTASSTSIVYICNPNNPTGTILSPEKLKSFCEVVSKKKPVFVDEAYIDYVADPKKNSMIGCVRSGHNIIVARTFSKLHAFAGLRIGYIVALPETIKELSKYSTNGGTTAATSLAAAIASYQDKEYAQYTVKKNTESKEFLYKTLKEAGYDYIPSHTNFVLFPLRMDGTRFRDEMMKRGVGLRNWHFNDQHWCRISIGHMDEMQLFAEAFKQLA